MKIKNELIERRRYIRLAVPVNFSYSVSGSNLTHNAVTKNISADGACFDTIDNDVRPNDLIEIRLDIADAQNPVHITGKAIWRKKLTLEDNAPFNVGIEFIEIEDDNKNTFLKFLCDLIYGLSTKEKKNDKRKK